ncbi:MAG: hypothetical protein WA324_00295 [Bryobacteraceae bacterium]
MTPRSIRRAAERKALKEARKAARLTDSPEEIQPAPGRPISEAQLTANQANAQLSTGPKSAEGKAKSSLNAVRTGLTGKTILLPSDDAEAYTDHIASHVARWNPVTTEEHETVQDFAQTKWRLARIPQLEEDLWALGSVMFANMFEDQPDDIRPGLIRAHTLLTFGKRFDNLALQESRLMRHLNNLYKQLRELLAQREAAELDTRAVARAAASHQNGFEFSDSVKVRPEDSFGSLSPEEKARVLEEVNQRFAKPGARPRN